MKPLMKLQAKLSVEVSVLLGRGTNYQVTHHIPEEPRHQLHSWKGQNPAKPQMLGICHHIEGFSLTLSLYMYIYMCMCTCVFECVCVCITTNSKVTVLQLTAFRFIFIFYGFYGMF
jgi:hypothetical protein